MTRARGPTSSCAVGWRGWQGAMGGPFCFLLVLTTAVPPCSFDLIFPAASALSLAHPDLTCAPLVAPSTSPPRREPLRPAPLRPPPCSFRRHKCWTSRYGVARGWLARGSGGGGRVVGGGGVAGGVDRLAFGPPWLVDQWIGEGVTREGEAASGCASGGGGCAGRSFFFPFLFPSAVPPCCFRFNFPIAHPRSPCPV